MNIARAYSLAVEYIQMKKNPSRYLWEWQNGELRYFTETKEVHEATSGEGKAFRSTHRSPKERTRESRDRNRSQEEALKSIHSQWVDRLYRNVHSSNHGL